jgi:eukaryotic-like serine/threonine-protein kinase
VACWIERHFSERNLRSERTIAESGVDAFAFTGNFIGFLTASQRDFAMVLATCPTLADLEQFFSGGVPAPENEAMEEHVQQCATCMANLKTLLRSNDTLVEAMAGDTAADDLVSGPILADLMRKLEGLQPRSMEDGAQTLPPSSQSDAVAGGELAKSLVDFLGPAESTDELGRLGKYRILKVLGHGGMGVVFLGEDTKLHRAVAIKAMLPALAASATAGQRFLREAQAMAAVEHDHIVRIYQVDEDRGVPFLAMEFLKGETLEARLTREEKLPATEILRIGREVAEALEAAHATDLIHRDIKPGNIWLEAPRGRVKILDFGLARASSQESGITQQGLIVGTPSFMAPEQARGETGNARSDLFSLGVVLYRLCTGRQPFLGKDTVSTLMEVALHEPPVPLHFNPDVPNELSDLVMQLLAKTAADRPASARAAADRLQAIQQALASAASPATPVSPVAKVAAKSPARRRSLLAAAIVLLCLMPLSYYFGGAVVRIAANKGELVVNSDDPNIEVTVKGATATVYDKVKDRSFVLTAGDYDVTVEVREKGEVTRFATKKFTITRNGVVTFDATLQLAQAPPKVPAEKGKTPVSALPPLDAGWLEKAAAMPVEEQVAAVKAELIKRNPKFDGKIDYKLDKNGAASDVKFSADHVTDISPVRAFTEMRWFNCIGSGPHKGALADLSPLRGMKLVVLSIMETQVADLSPVQGMPLIQIWFSGTQVSDLSALRDLNLTQLGFERTKIADLTPLKGMKLIGLLCGDTPIDDLTPLRGMNLQTLKCQHTPVSDLSPLRGMSLFTLGVQATKVTDLSPLKQTKVRQLTCDFLRERDEASLRAIPTLKTINGKAVAEIWK